MILTKTNIQAKYQNGISYDLLLCFLAENETVRFISSYEATNVVLTILGGCFISEIVLNLSFR